MCQNECKRVTDFMGEKMDGGRGLHFSSREHFSQNALFANLGQ
jgi:hypothetical protein